MAEPESLTDVHDLPLAGQMRKVLYDEILAGDLPPGTRLDEIKLAQRFGVSRTPVREALREMVSTGIAEHHHRRGVFVSQIPEDQLAEMFVYAAELEAVCTRLAAQNMSVIEREALIAVHLESHQHVNYGNIDAYDESNKAFHEALLKGSHNRSLYDATVQARTRVAPFRRAQFLVDDRLATSFEEHSLIVLAIMNGDGDGADNLIRTHIEHSRERLSYNTCAMY